MQKKDVTMKDIAREAGVSQSAVSMILNQKTASFPSETIDRVLSTAAKMGYSFRAGSKPAAGNNILVLAPQMTSPFFSSMLQSIDRSAIPQGIHVLSACTYHSPEVEETFLHMAIKQKFLGIIFLYPPDNEAALRSVASRIPVVTICDRPNLVAGDLVELNNFDGGAMAARHLPCHPCVRHHFRGSEAPFPRSLSHSYQQRHLEGHTGKGQLPLSGRFYSGSEQKDL